MATSAAQLPIPLRAWPAKRSAKERVRRRCMAEGRGYRPPAPPPHRFVSGFAPSGRKTRHKTKWSAGDSVELFEGRHAGGGLEEAVAEEGDHAVVDGDV